MPFRRLCASFGADVTMSEMSYARNLVKGNVVERTHLRQAANEHCFGDRPAHPCSLQAVTFMLLAVYSKCVDHS